MVVSGRSGLVCFVLFCGYSDEFALTWLRISEAEGRGFLASKPENSRPTSGEDRGEVGSRKAEGGSRKGEVGRGKSEGGASTENQAPSTKHQAL